MKLINTLLLSGANIHDWARSTPFVAKLLEDSGRFTVTIATDPSAALEDAGQLAQYDLFLTEYLGPEWSEVAKSNFERAVASGTTPEGPGIPRRTGRTRSLPRSPGANGRSPDRRAGAGGLPGDPECAAARGCAWRGRYWAGVSRRTPHSCGNTLCRISSQPAPDRTIG